MNSTSKGPNFLARLLHNFCALQFRIADADIAPHRVLWFEWPFVLFLWYARFIWTIDRSDKAPIYSFYRSVAKSIMGHESLTLLSVLCFCSGATIAGIYYVPNWWGLFMLYAIGHFLFLLYFARCTTMEHRLWPWLKLIRVRFDLRVQAVFTLYFLPYLLLVLPLLDRGAWNAIKFNQMVRQPLKSIYISTIGLMYVFILLNMPTAESNLLGYWHKQGLLSTAQAVLLLILTFPVFYYVAGLFLMSLDALSKTVIRAGFAKYFPYRSTDNYYKIELYGIPFSVRLICALLCVTILGVLLYLLSYQLSTGGHSFKVIPIILLVTIIIVKALSKLVKSLNVRSAINGYFIVGTRRPLAKWKLRNALFKIDEEVYKEATTIPNGELINRLSNKYSTFPGTRHGVYYFGFPPQLWLYTVRQVYSIARFEPKLSTDQEYSYYPFDVELFHPFTKREVARFIYDYNRLAVTAGASGDLSCPPITELAEAKSMQPIEELRDRIQRMCTAYSNLLPDLAGIITLLNTQYTQWDVVENAFRDGFKLRIVEEENGFYFIVTGDDAESFYTPIALTTLAIYCALSPGKESLV